ncbi:MAG: hypothetical protein HYZ75_03765 [Elusimicrobia bacterium]|nr:hypothetical protein [Elusimicrobiota bacterium]
MNGFLRSACLMTAVLLIPALGAAAPPVDSCRDCHKDERFRVQNKKIYDYYQDWSGSAHDRAGLSCTDCHGGDKAQAEQAAAHAGILPQSDPQSPFHYKNIPRTCGRCHDAVLQRFVKSRHYAQLESAGRGPSCITCHGALDTKVYSSSIIERACAGCHNAKTKNRPEVIAQAKEILERLNHANGYRRGLKFYYESVGKPQAMKKADASYDDIVLFWHEFDFKRLPPRSQELLAELKALYNAAHKDRKGP